MLFQGLSSLQCPKHLFVSILLYLEAPCVFLILPCWPWIRGVWVSERVQLISDIYPQPQSLRNNFSPHSLSQSCSLRGDKRVSCRCLGDLKRRPTTHGGLYLMASYPKMSPSWTPFPLNICPSASLGRMENSLVNVPSKFEFHTWFLVKVSMDYGQMKITFHRSHSYPEFNPC